jgi:hypothetical protein
MKNSQGVQSCIQATAPIIKTKTATDMTNGQGLGSTM